MTVLQIKRVYDDIAPSDGCRILIDRLWPRGIPRPALQLDDWAQDIAPSSKIRKAFNHDPANFTVFREQYRSELENNPAAQAFLDRVAEGLREGNVTLLYAARSETVNHAVILRDWVNEQLAGRNR